MGNVKLLVTYVEGILGLINDSLLSKLSLLSITEISPLCKLPDLNSNAFTVSMHFTNTNFYLEISKILLAKYDVLKRDPQMYASIESNSLDLKDLVQKHMKELRVYGDQGTLSVSGEFPFCPHFTHFSAKNYYIDDSVTCSFHESCEGGKVSKFEANSVT